jgi:hypothetical protein
MKKVLNANAWLEKNKNKYINGCSVSVVMEAYAVYYFNNQKK